MRINPAQQVHGAEEINAAIQTIKSGRWAEGPRAIQFRHALSKFLNVKNVTLVNSGSSANLAAIMALTTHWIPEDRRLNKGDEVITTALCFPTTVSPIIYAGAVPVFVDVDETWNIDPEEVRKAITPKTKAVIAAHALGNPFNLTELKKICKEHNLWLIQDNCDSLDSKWDGKRTGVGDIGTSSFYPAHHISTGEGGAVYTNNPTLHKAIKSMVNWGRDCICNPGQDNACGKRYTQQHGGLPYGYDHKNTYSEWGFNLKMTDIQASLGIEQLKKLHDFTDIRRENHKFLWNLFAEYKWFDLPKRHPESKPSWFGYVIKLKQAPFTKQEFVDHLEKKGIQSRAFFCGNITKQPVLYRKKCIKLKLDRSNDVMENAFWIGVHPAIGNKERKYMKKVITNFLDKY